MPYDHGTVVQAAPLKLYAPDVVKVELNGEI
jgi:hypothetical protein